MIRVRVRVTLRSTVYMKGAGGRGSKLHLSRFVSELSSRPLYLVTCESFFFRLSRISNGIYCRIFYKLK